MAGGLFNRIKTWIYNEDVLSADLNGELDNVISHLESQYLGGYSANVAQMQSMADPGGTGTEILATSEAGELQRLRFALARILGTTNWYDTPALSIQGINTIMNVGGATPLSRLISGKIDAYNQPQFLVANGANATLKCLGTSTNLVYTINSAQKTLSADVTSNPLTLAPSSNNTATLNGAISSDTTSMVLTGAGSAIVALVGSFAAFKINSEVMLGYIDSSTGVSRLLRGVLFDSTGAPSTPANHVDTSTVTLLKMSWVFLDQSGVLAQTTNTPSYGGTAPVSPSNGDYWFDTSVGLWKAYNGSTWVLSNSLLVGIGVCDTANCIATRSFDFFRSYANTSRCLVGIFSNSQARTSDPGFEVSSYGHYFASALGYLEWNTATSLDSGVVLSPSQTYCAYLKDTGTPVLTTTPPVNRRFDLRGWYHPSRPWRAIATLTTDGSSNLSTVKNYQSLEGDDLRDLSIGYGKIVMPVLGQNVQFTATVTGTVVTNVGSAVSFTATGRPIRIWLEVPQGLSGSVAFNNTVDGAGTTMGGKIGYTLGSGDLGMTPFTMPKSTGGGGLDSRVLPPHMFAWEYPSGLNAGTTFSFQLRAAGNGANDSVVFTNVTLNVEEF